jgi:hypothetical protein
MGRIRAECFVCGLDFYQDEMVRHYKSGKLVDINCADDISHTDHYAMLWQYRRPEERQRSEQPVSFQGEVPREGDGWYVSKWYKSQWRG